MKTSNSFALLGEDDNVLVAEPEQNTKRKIQQKGGAQGGGGVGVGGGSAQVVVQKAPELTAEQRRAKAEKIFKQNNALSEGEKRERNIKKKQKKVEKTNTNSKNPASPKTTDQKPSDQKPRDNKSTTTTTPANTTNQKVDPKASTATTAPAAAPVVQKTPEELKKENELTRSKKVQNYINAVNQALPGSTIFFKLNLNELQKDKRAILDELPERWKKSIDRIIVSELFLTKFLAALPPSYGNKTASDVLPIGRHDMNAVQIPEVPKHLAGLLSGFTQSGERKENSEVIQLVEEFLEGLFDYNPKPKKNFEERRRRDEEEHEETENERVGSSGNVRSGAQFDLSAFVKTSAANPKPIKAKGKAAKGAQNKNQQQENKTESTASTATEEGSSSSSSAPQGKGKEKEDQVVETKPTEVKPEENKGTVPAEGEKKEEAGGFGRIREKAERKEKSEFDPSTFLSDSLLNELDSKAEISKKIPKGWKVGYVTSPIFLTGATATQTSAKSGGRGRGAGGRGGGRGQGGAGGRGGAEPNTNTNTDNNTTTPGEKPKYESGFMYSKNGLDHAYVLWKGEEMMFLFTTGKEVKNAPQKVSEEKKSDQPAAPGGKPAWKVPRKDI